MIATNASLNMTMKKHSILNVPMLTILATLFCCAGITTEGQQTKNVASNVLSNFPGFHLLTVKTLSGDVASANQTVATSRHPSSKADIARIRNKRNDERTEWSTAAYVRHC